LNSRLREILIIVHNAVISSFLEGSFATLTYKHSSLSLMLNPRR